MAVAQPTDADFQQAVAAYQQSPSNAKAAQIIKLAAAMDQLPPIPEEARKHFVRGAALFKDAKSPDDFKQVIDEFMQATRLAPWWPEARYNLALAFEAAGEYAWAIDKLKLYQLSNSPKPRHAPSRTRSTPSKPNRKRRRKKRRKSRRRNQVRRQSLRGNRKSLQIGGFIKSQAETIAIRRRQSSGHWSQVLGLATAVYHRKQSRHAVASVRG